MKIAGYKHGGSIRLHIPEIKARGCTFDPGQRGIHRAVDIVAQTPVRRRCFLRSDPIGPAPVVSHFIFQCTPVPATW